MEGIVTKTQTMSWAQFGLYEYLLVAHPNTAVNAKVLAEKQNFYDQYGQKTAIKTQPHITIASFVAREEMEDTIVKWIQRICSNKQSFNVMLNNYSGLPPHTVYLRIQNQQPFKQLANELKVIDNYVRSSGCPPAQFIQNPHLTIAKRLPETLYLKALMDYSQKTFHENFMVNQLVLLRRANHFDNCKSVYVFHLQPSVSNLYN
jgi:2'-5' RNA ligase